MRVRKIVGNTTIVSKWQVISFFLRFNYSFLRVDSSSLLHICCLRVCVYFLVFLRFFWCCCVLFCFRDRISFCSQSQSSSCSPGWPWDSEASHPASASCILKLLCYMYTSSVLLFKENGHKIHAFWGNLLRSQLFS